MPTASFLNASANRVHSPHSTGPEVAGCRISGPGTPKDPSSPRRSTLAVLEIAADSCAMELSAHEDVIGQFVHLADALIEGPDNWMPGMFESPTAKITELEADTPFGLLSRSVPIELGPVQRSDDVATVPIRWHSLDSEALFPVFDGQLRLQRIADGRSRLELKGSYKPPGGIVGRAADAIVMHSVAEATVEDFVHRVAAVVGRNALARTVAHQVEAGQLTLDSDP